MKKKRSKRTKIKKQESRTTDPVFDPAYTNVTNLKDGNLYAVQGCYRKKRLPSQP